ncbi:MAG: metallophosphoesterase [Thermoplasmata archaeon]|nr:metallophosphoesterase [Thermoplasmata archaeon]
MDTFQISSRIIDKPLETDWLGYQEITKFLKISTSLLAEQPNIARLSGTTIFTGDIHGDMDSMLAAFRIAEQHDAKIVFLGDIVDRGSHNVECMNLILAHIHQEPDRFFYTRGNHEFQGINTKWGFMDSVVEKYPETVYWLYNGAFTQLPIAALWDDRIFGIHGGISRHLKILADIEALEHQDRGFRDEYLDLLWNDPAIEPQKGFVMNDKRGIFYTFGQDVFDEFMETNHLELFIRGHNKQTAGHRYFFDDRLISIFTSADHYKDTVPSVVLIEGDGSHEIIKL